MGWRPPGMGKSEVLVALSEWRAATGWDGGHQGWGEEGFWLLYQSGGRQQDGMATTREREKKDPGCFYVVAWKDRGIETKKAHRYGALF